MSGTTSTANRLQALVYLRVSTEEQVGNYSLGTQLDICRKEAERRGYDIAETFREEGRSAKTITDRPKLIEMLAYCRQHRRQISAVIVYRLDRISRQTADYLAIRKKLFDLDITIISATEPTGDTPTDKFVETMLAGFAQMDNDVRSERTKNGMKARFMTGLPNGNVPLGYVCENGYATKDPKNFSALKAAWQLMATGTKSLDEMAHILNDQGIRDKQKGGQELTLRQQTLSGVFRNKFYAGKIISKKYGLEVQGQHTPMITEEQFYRVQAILDGRNHKTAASIVRRSQDNLDFPLRRIIKCSRCHQGFTAAWSTGKRARYGYYFCAKRCGPKLSVSLKEIEDTTSQLLTKISLRPETTELINAYLRQTYFLRIGALRKKREQAEIELKKLYELRQALIEKNLSGVYSDDIFKEQNKLLEAKVSSVQAAKSDTVIEKYNLEAITKFIQAKFTDLNNTFASSLLKQKRVLVCSIFPRGLSWGYPGYSNTFISPFYRCLSDVYDNKDLSGVPDEFRTHDLQFHKLAL